MESDAFEAPRSAKEDERVDQRRRRLKITNLFRVVIGTASSFWPLRCVPPVAKADASGDGVGCDDDRKEEREDRRCVALRGAHDAGAAGDDGPQLIKARKILLQKSSCGS
jgi:hypothetical protein